MGRITDMSTKEAALRYQQDPSRRSNVNEQDHLDMTHHYGFI